MQTLMHSDLKLTGVASKYKGKVREVYALENDILVMVATDRLSAFDVVMPKGIPYKGQILNQNCRAHVKSHGGYSSKLACSHPRP